MRIHRLLLFIGGFLLLLGTLSAGAYNPQSPDDVPDLLGIQATDYVIQAPKLFYLYNPLCAPILSAEGETPEANVDQPQKERGDQATNGTESGLLTQYVGRTAVHGAEPRQMYDFTFDLFCEPPDEPDIISDIVADDDYVYWISNEQDALVKVSEDRLDWETVPPEIVYAHTARNAELEMVGDNIYMLQTGFGTTGLYRINKNTGASTQLLNGSQVGTTPFDFQTDGQYLFWRQRNGSVLNLDRYNLTTGAHSTIVSGATNPVYSYYPVAGNVVYVGLEDVIRAYDHATGTLGSPLYTSAVSSWITSITADGSALYFIQQHVCDPACPGRYTLYRLPFGGSAATLFFTDPGEVQTMHSLQRHENTLFFIHDDEMKKIRTNADVTPLTNLRIDGFEITQAIQSDSNDVDLVRGKRTAVRLFASSDGVAIPGIYARLYRVDGSGTIIDGPLSPINLERVGSYLRVPETPDRDNINESFTFFLPPGWVDDPTLRLRAELNPFRFPPEPSYTDNVLTTSTFDMDASGRFEAHFILFEYDSGGDRYRPDYRQDYLQAVSWVRRAYPVASAPGGHTDPSPGFRPKMSWLYDADLGGNVDGTDRHPDCQRRLELSPGDEGYLDDPSLCAAWYVVCPILDSIRAAEGLDSSIQLVGMVSDARGFARGWACGGGVNVPTGPGDWGWDFDGSYGDWYSGHEIGHSQGRGHPSQGNECGHSASDPGYPWPGAEIGDESYRGFDVGDTGLNSLLVPRVYPNEWHDMMSYCMAPGQWISAYTYLGIKAQIEAATAALQQSFGGEYLQLSGVIFPDGNEAALTQVRLWDSLASPPPAPVPGDYRIHLFDGGTEVATYDFTPEEGEMEIGLTMGEFVPFVMGTDHIEISHPASGDILWSYDISASAPTVSDVQLDGAPSPVVGTVMLQWTAVDADGDPLTYDVLYSRDNGATWQMVDMGLTTTSALIDTSVLGGSSQARFKVIANDGLNQGQAMSAALTVANKAPVISVLTPHDGEMFAFGQEVYFTAEVLDYQDGTLFGSDIEWRDQTGFLLGTGTEFSQDNLLIGENIITVTATNNDGLSTAVTFSIFVDDELELPPATLTAGPDQVGWHVADGATALQTATVAVSNSGEGSFTVTTSEDAPWLNVSQSGSSTPLELTLTADPAFLSPGQTLAAELQIIGTSANGTQTVTVPVSMAMGYISMPGGGEFTLYLPVMLKP